MSSLTSWCWYQNDNCNILCSFTAKYPKPKSNLIVFLWISKGKNHSLCSSYLWVLIIPPLDLQHIKGCFVFWFFFSFSFSDYFSTSDPREHFQLLALSLLLSAHQCTKPAVVQWFSLEPRKTSSHEATHLSEITQLCSLWFVKSWLLPLVHFRVYNLWTKSWWLCEDVS